jgi:hypothetical protein
MANPAQKTPRKQHSVWLILGGALLVSVFGWAGIVRQTEGPVQSDPLPLDIAVVELPVAQAAQHIGAAEVQAPTNRTTTAAPLRQVTRPVLRSRSSN